MSLILLFIQNQIYYCKHRKTQGCYATLLFCVVVRAVLLYLFSLGNHSGTSASTLVHITTLGKPFIGQIKNKESTRKQ